METLASLFTIQQIILAIIFLIIFALLATNEERKMYYLFGGVIVLGILGYILIDKYHFEEVLAHIEWEVIIILFSMSLLVEVLNRLKVFDYISIKLLVYSKGSLPLLHLILLSMTFFISAFLDNLTAIILMGNLTLTIARGLEIDPKPFIVSEIFVTFVAGISTPVSSLPAIIVSVQGDLNFVDFFLYLGPLILLIFPLSVVWYYLTTVKSLDTEEMRSRELTKINLDKIALDFILPDRRSFFIASVVLALMVVGFITVGLLPADFPQISVGFVALTSATLIIFLTKQPLNQVLKDIHWNNIVFLLGLFLLVGTLESSGFIEELAALLGEVTEGDPVVFGLVLGLFSAPASAVVDNIPITAALARVINSFAANNPDVSTHTMHFIWMVVLVSGKFGAGFTPIGSITAIVGLNMLKKEGRPVSLGYYFQKVTLASFMFMVVGVLYLFLVMVVLLG